ncbi:MAG: cation diffusion facilitator family transporter [Sphingobacteriales bacterium]
MKSRSFLLVALIVDILIALSKFVAAGFTGSSSMLSEGIHSVIDGVSQLMLIWGVKSSNRKADEIRPFGYGKELYFWAFMVSLVIFILGGCISFYEGLMQLKKPEFNQSQTWNYVILAIAFVFNMVSMVTALKAFNKHRGRKPFFEEIMDSKDPSIFIALLGDAGDLICLIVAFMGVCLGHLFNNPYYDGAASMAIGVVMILISLLLVRESKSLLMGEPTSRRTLRKVTALAEADSAVIKVKKHFSTYMGPEEILLQLNTVFEPNLSTKEITDAIERITKSIQAKFPRMKQIFMEPVAK